MTQVLADPLKNHRSQLDLPNKRVAASAEEPADASCVVTVINHEVTIGGTTKQASTMLRLRHCVNLFGREVVLPHQARPEILRLRGLGVRSTPLAETLVAASLVRLSVSAAALVRARLAVGPEVLARLREGRKRQVSSAVRAALHVLSMTYRRDNVWHVDQPCHADVLLELANGGAQ